MPDLFLPEVPSVAPSKRRSLVRDACGCLHQQMFFWGCDARHPDGNLLIRHGLTRIARCESGEEDNALIHRSAPVTQHNARRIRLTLDSPKNCGC